MKLENPSSGPIAVSSPGGQARQYRVQTLDSDGQWRLYGSFRHLDQAEQCVARLQQRNVPSRLVRINICPAAA